MHVRYCTIVPHSSDADFPLITASHPLDAARQDDHDEHRDAKQHLAGQSSRSRSGAMRTMPNFYFSPVLNAVDVSKLTPQQRVAHDKAGESSGRVCRRLLD